MAIVVEYSVAFWMLTLGRCRVPPIKFVELAVVAIDVPEFDVDTVDVDVNDVDGVVESNNSC